MIPLNYHHLYYFWVVTRAGSISAAGEELLLAQSTLSLQLQDLEKALGRKLLYRERKGVSLTSDGELAFQYCEDIFSRGQSLISAFKKDGAPAAGVLKIGIEESVSHHLVLPLLAFMRRLDPRLGIWISGGTPKSIQDRLHRRQIDLAVSSVDVSYQLGSGFRSRLMASVPLFFVAAPAIKRRMRGFPQGLKGIPMLLRTPENPVRKEVDQFLRRHKIAPLLAAEVDDVELLRTLAVEGHGAAVLDALALREDLARGRLVKLRQSPLGARESVWFIAGGPSGEASPLRRVIGDLMEHFPMDRKILFPYRKPGNGNFV